jgi:hypothetical protein
LQEKKVTEQEKKLLTYLGLGPIVESMTMKLKVDSSSDKEGNSLSSRPDSPLEERSSYHSEESKKSVPQEEEGAVRR